MLRFVVRCGLLLPVLLVAWAAAGAQGRATRVSASVGATSVHLDGFGAGRFTAAVATLGVNRRLGTHGGGELTAFTVIPTGNATVMPACLPNVLCTGRSTPSAVNGVLVSPYLLLGADGLRLSAGGGLITASGHDLTGKRSGGVFTASLDWTPTRRARLAPTVGIRLVQTMSSTSSVAGVRRMVLPGVGLSF